MRVFKITQGNRGPYLVLETADEVAEVLTDAQTEDEIGTLYHVEIVERTREELDALPEFDGW